MSVIGCPAECAKSARAACFVRYKEKKQNRKSGKIRYEMRKLNAEKRPRIRVRTTPLLCYVRDSQILPALLLSGVVAM